MVFEGIEGFELMSFWSSKEKYVFGRREEEKKEEKKH